MFLITDVPTVIITKTDNAHTLTKCIVKIVVYGRQIGIPPTRKGRMIYDQTPTL